MNDKRTGDFIRQLASGQIPDEIPTDLEYQQELTQLAAYLEATRDFALALANGDLTASLQGVSGPVAGSLKSHQAALKHLTWQATRIAAGDFSQRVDFMGEFSVAFNRMVERLDESRRAMDAMNVKLQDDVIQLQSLSAALRESEARFRLIAENVSDVIWTIDVSGQRFTYVSPSVAAVLGFSVEEIMTKSLEETLPAQSLASIRGSMARFVERYSKKADTENLSEKLELEQRGRDGRILAIEVSISPITDAQGQIKEFVGVSRDITERKKVEEKLRYRSTHDSQTGLYNRAFFDAELERISAGRQFPISFIIADLDGLKRVNDTLGHDAGDQIIKGAAAILRSVFRAEDVIARTGGDEFTVILSGTEQEIALESVVRIGRTTDEYNRKNKGPAVSISLGVATATNCEEVPQALKTADERMYADKLRRKQQRK